MTLGGTPKYAVLLVIIQSIKSIQHLLVHQNTLVKCGRAIKCELWPLNHLRKRTAESTSSHWVDREMLLSALPTSECPGPSNEEDRVDIPTEYKPVTGLEYTFSLMSSAFTSVLPDNKHQRIRRRLPYPCCLRD